MIQMNDFTSEPEELRWEELAAVERVLRSGRFILGNEVQQFEEAWAKFCGTKFCAGVGNGMDAIELGLRALDIGPGDEVITTSMTAIATALAIMHAGASLVLADVDPRTALLDFASVERCLTPGTKAVLLVHLRQEIARKYLSTIDNGRIELLSPPNAEQNHVYHLFVIRCAERDRLAHFLDEHGIETLIHYPLPVHRQRCCKNARCDFRGLSAAASHAEQCLSLPCHPQLHDDDVAKITATTNQFE